MPPSRNNRNITDFFRPAQHPPQPQASSNPPAGSSSNRRIWPAPRTQKRRGHAPTQQPTPPPLPPPSKTARRNTNADLDSNDDASMSPQIATPATSSSLSSLPSQPLTSSFNAPSSQRIIKHGKEAVLDSDSEIGSGSDSELEDVSFLLSGGKPEAKAAKTPKGKGLQDAATYSKSRYAQIAGDRIIPAASPAAKYKFSLNALKAKSKENAATEAMVAEVTADLADKEERRMDLDEDALNANLIATAYEDEGDREKAQRMLQAVQRTDALHLDTVWHFFQTEISTPTPKPFPTSSLPQSWKLANMKTSTSRRQLFVSGFVRAWVTLQQLPDEVVQWMLDELCTEPGHELQDAYVLVLSESEKQLRKLLTPQRVEQLFRRMSAKPESMNISCTMDSTKEIPKRTKRPLPQGLLPVLQLCSKISHAFPPETSTYTLVVLCRLLYDDSVQADEGVRSIIEAAIGNLINNLSDSTFDDIIHSLTTSLLTTLSHPTLQALLTTSLPTHTPRQQALKRALALAFFLKESIPSTTHLLSADLTAEVLSHLSSDPLYTNLDHTTDYAALTAKMTLLDIAIDSGFGVAHVSLAQQPDLTRVRGSVPDAPAPGHDKVQPQPKDAARQFNTAVDTLSLKLRSIEGRIRDSGATNMARREAKDAVSAVKFRLEATVRVGERRKRGIFADGDEETGMRLFAWAKGGRGEVKDG